METLALLGAALGLGFTSGINLYATVFATGLAIRLGWLTLPPAMDGLAVLADGHLLAVAGALYAIEFVADKVPAVDHAWDVLHAFVRPLGAALIAWVALGGADLAEPVEIAAILLVGGVALGAHAAKSGTRLIAASFGGHALGVGVLLSFMEDALALLLAPLSLILPLLALAGVLAFAVAFAVVAPRLLRAAWSRLRRKPATPGR